MNTTNETNRSATLSSIADADLAAVTGGFGEKLLDAARKTRDVVSQYGIIGPIQDWNNADLRCSRARHWEAAARQPGATDAVKAGARHARQFCPSGF